MYGSCQPFAFNAGIMKNNLRQTYYFNLSVFYFKSRIFVITVPVMSQFLSYFVKCWFDKN